MDIITDLGQRLKALISDAPVANLSWPCLNYTGQTDDALAELIAKEMHGYQVDGTPPVAYRPITFLQLFGLLNDGRTVRQLAPFRCQTPMLDSFETESGYIWPAAGHNRMKRRHPRTLPNGDRVLYKKIGLYSYWSWCWPINRRIVYNRASCYQSDGGSSGAGLAGDPLAPTKYVMKWDGAAWRGDQWDGGAAPGSALPFIMNKEGFGHEFGGWTV
jgi:hypothetical protein